MPKGGGGGGGGGGYHNFLVKHNFFNKIAFRNLNIFKHKI